MCSANGDTGGQVSISAGSSDVSACGSISLNAGSSNAINGGSLTLKSGNVGVDGELQVFQEAPPDLDMEFQSASHRVQLATLVQVI